MIQLLARLVRDREVSCTELVERSLRLAEAGRGLGAVVALRAEQALAEAGAADAALAPGRRLPGR